MMKQIDIAPRLLRFAVVLRLQTRPDFLLNGTGKQNGSRMVRGVPDLQSVNLLLRERVHVDADKHAARNLLGNLAACPEIQRLFPSPIVGVPVIQQDVAVPRQCHTHAVFRQKVTDAQGQIEVDRLLLQAVRADRTAVLATVSGIQNHRPRLRSGRRPCPVLPARGNIRQGKSRTDRRQRQNNPPKPHGSLHPITPSLLFTEKRRRIFRQKKHG